MKWYWVTFAIITGFIWAMVLTGCASSTGYKPDLAERFAADLRCVGQLAIDGVGVADNPAFKGVKTAADVATAVNAASSISTEAFKACADTLEYVGYDLSALKAKIKK